jgi:hypothetical protein
VDGDKVYGKPCINLNHPRGQRTVEEVESGFLNAASFGNFVVLEISTNPADYMDGQEGPSVSKWFNRECSLVDVPGNFNALTELYDKDNNLLKLEDLIANQKSLLMKQLFLTAEQLGLLNLKAETADTNAVGTALASLAAEAAKVPNLISDLAAARTAKKTAEDALEAFKTSQDATTIENLIADGVTNKKFTVEVGNKLKAAYAGKPTELKALVDAMPVYTGIVASIGSGVNAERIKELSAKTWNQMDKSGELTELKAIAFDVFKDKYKATFKKEFE